MSTAEIEYIPVAYTEEQLLASICRESFWEFVKAFWETVPGAGTLISNWHMEYIADELQTIAERIFRGESNEYDTIINISPGTSKSTLCSILFPAWTWTWYPQCRHITASHTDTLVLDLATKSRHVIESDLYRKLFPHIQLRSDQDTKGYFANTLGGDRFSCTVGGKTPTGMHAHILINDDLIDPQKVLSEAELDQAARFIPDILQSRKVNKDVSTTILIMQRLHPMDPTGVMLENAKKEGATPVRHICLPAELCDHVNPPELKERYIDGLMDPIRLSHKALAPYRANAYTYAGQFLQLPIPLGGGLFKIHYFSKRVRAAPFDSIRIRYWDRASSTNEAACFTAGVLMARDTNGWFYIEHVEHGQWEPVERNKVMRAVALRDKAKYGPKHVPTIYVEAEGGSSGRDAWLGVVKALAGFYVKEDKVTGSKDTRAEPLSTQFAAGTVFLVEDGSWDINGYIKELTLFRPMPGKRLGKRCDQVDASSGAFNVLAKYSTTPLLRTYSFGNKSKKGIIRCVVCSKEELPGVIITDHKCLLLYVREPGNLYGSDNREGDGSHTGRSNGVSVPGGVSEILGHLVSSEFGNKQVHGNNSQLYGSERQGDNFSHGLSNVLGTEVLCFGNVEPSRHQETWDDVVSVYGRPIREVMMTEKEGKKLWSFLLRKRDPAPDVFVLCDEVGGEVSLSLALAICEVLRLDRNQCIYRVSQPDNTVGNATPPNRHVYDMTKATRGLVC